MKSDAGIWEYRGRQRVHTHSAACARPASTGSRPSRNGSAYQNAWRIETIADPLHAELIDRAWNPKREAFTAAFESDDLDASVLLLAELGACARF